ncbi:apolipoprotein N-acyltransferase [Paraburkholderia caballeronis]|uniref:Apolipoprotein N-acyltransferase n=1 Tax=Paraburkholderia caballeronis TaxID=416943 RepID=A0A1H7PXN9_9BURK|nr:apolipoprotein N-acyltransferase [Paraburkholderia caballeronis]PXW24366.1 apolipoprotein N-acyltransferase [Paraburkholderia caballeronis]PXX00148.1 apolipoprotein N-acyltransferase [Paraburkholderia caballeronis]RAJ97277.1 apolipoprotein N-acyltransferase [Paraburkholderia caballeronis]SEB66164.1 apolipoprotein N-acyltransferase [Paraburkholderia caballeronis]SEL39807.1 apolipoprotein N-acyltransferase [Paraburkholderia caballeronis]
MAEPIRSPARDDARPTGADSAASSRSASNANGAGRVAAATRRTLPFWHYVAAVAAGALHTLSFAPTPHGGWLSIAIFAFFYFWLTRTTGWRSALLTGWAFGFGNFVTGVWWLYVSMHTYGGMPAALAGAALVLFSLYLGLYPALAAALWSFCAGHASHGNGNTAARDPRPFSPTWHGAFAFASAWALGEWARGTVFTGFPWLASGYPQVDGPLAGFAPIVGVYGVGWMLALVAALVVQALVRVSEARAARRTGNAARAVERSRIATPALGAAALIVAGLLLPLVSWTLPANAPLDVRLLQGNVKQEMKFEEAGMVAALDEFRRLITDKPADLVVTPETAVPVLLQQMPEPFALAIRRFADSTGTAILFGAVGGTVTPEGRVIDYTNSLFGITPGVAGLYRYDKHHLVPFGEFVPWGFRWFVNLMNIPLGDFARGAPVQPPFMVHNQPVAVNICYEDIFGEEVARTVRENPTSAGVLINSTNLAWFGDTIALDQHLQIARMRSLETGRPMLRATNTGVTAAIDGHGNVIARLPTFTEGSLDVRIQGTTGFTPYVMSGNNTVLAVSLLLLAFGFAFGPGRAKRRTAADAER